MPKDGRNYDPPLIKSFLAQALKLNENVDVMLNDNTQLASAAASLWSHIKVCYIFVITYLGMLNLCVCIYPACKQAQVHQHTNKSNAPTCFSCYRSFNVSC